MTPPPGAGDRLAMPAAWLASGTASAAPVLAVLALGLLLALYLPGAVLLLPLALILNAAAVSVLVLEQGAAGAVRGVLVALLLLTPVALVGGAGLLGPALLFAWLPLALAGWVLRVATSLSLALLTLTGLALIVVLVAQQFGLGAESMELRQALLQVMSNLNQGLPKAELEATIDVVLKLSGGLLALVLLSVWSAGLCLGRSLQARLRRPGAFAQEFRALRLGRAYSGVVLLATVPALLLGLAGDGLAVELALVLAIPLLVQGLALIHAEVARRGWWRGLPGMAYLMLVVTPHVGLPLALLGLVDNWLDFRRRPLA